MHSSQRVLGFELLWESNVAADWTGGGAQAGMLAGPSSTHFLLCGRFLTAHGPAPVPDLGAGIPFYETCSVAWGWGPPFYKTHSVCWGGDPHSETRSVAAQWGPSFYETHPVSLAFKALHPLLPHYWSRKTGSLSPTTRTALLSPALATLMARPHTPWSCP